MNGHFTSTPGSRPPLFTGAQGYYAGLALGAAFFIGCLLFAARSSSPASNTLLCLFGGASGWFTGILISPTSVAEEGKFAGYGKAISAFRSGFIVAKLDRVFEEAVGKPGFQVEPVLIPTHLFGTTFVIGVLCTFAGRNFGQRG